MKKLSDYFKTIPAASQAAPATDSSQAQQQLLPPARQRTAVLAMQPDNDSDSPLSDCISVPSPTPPPPSRKPVVNPQGQVRAVNTDSKTQSSKSTSFNSVGINKGITRASATLRTTITSDGSKKKELEVPKTIIPDSEGEETDDSLEDVTILLKPRLKTTKPTKPEKKPEKKKEKQSEKKPEKTSKKLKQPQSQVTPSFLDIPTYTFSLDALISEKEKDMEREEAFQRTEALFAGAEELDHMTSSHQFANKGIVDAAVGSESGRKVFDMLNRREAWRVEYTWHFFDRSNTGEPQPKPRKPFPTNSLHGWQLGMKDSSTRNQMFSTGYIQDMCIIRPSLSPEIISWLLDELVLETREDLSFAYARTLEACLSQPHGLLDGIKILRLFELFGTSPNAVDLQKPIIMQIATGNSSKATRIKNQDIWNLKLLVRFIGNVAAELSNSTVHVAVQILIRLSLDEMFTKHGDILIDIENSIFALLMSRKKLDEENTWDKISLELSQALRNTFPEPRSQIRLLRILPISSPRTHLFRRRLSLTFLFEDPQYLTAPLSNLVSLSEFSSLLEKPRFLVKNDTDYSILKSLVEILDIAFDDGGVPSSENNKQVECVAIALKNMSSRIRDTGMASLERTEAKQVIELTQFRLQFAVVKGKKGASVLDQLREDIGDRGGKKQTLLSFGGK